MTLSSQSARGSDKPSDVRQHGRCGCEKCVAKRQREAEKPKFKRSLAWRQLSEEQLIKVMVFANVPVLKGLSGSSVYDPKLFRKALEGSTELEIDYANYVCRLEEALEQGALASSSSDLPLEASNEEKVQKERLEGELGKEDLEWLSVFLRSYVFLQLMDSQREIVFSYECQHEGCNNKPGLSPEQLANDMYLCPEHRRVRASKLRKSCKDFKEVRLDDTYELLENEDDQAIMKESENVDLPPNYFALALALIELRKSVLTKLMVAEGVDYVALTREWYCLEQEEKFILTVRKLCNPWKKKLVKCAKKTIARVVKPLMPVVGTVAKEAAMTFLPLPLQKPVGGFVKRAFGLKQDPLFDAAKVGIQQAMRANVQHGAHSAAPVEADQQVQHLRREQEEARRQAEEFRREQEVARLRAEELRMERERFEHAQALAHLTQLLTDEELSKKNCELRIVESQHALEHFNINLDSVVKKIAASGDLQDAISQSIAAFDETIAVLTEQSEVVTRKGAKLSEEIALLGTEIEDSLREMQHLDKEQKDLHSKRTATFRDDPFNFSLLNELDRAISQAETQQHEREKKLVMDEQEQAKKIVKLEEDVRVEKERIDREKERKERERKDAIARQQEEARRQAALRVQQEAERERKRQEEIRLARLRREQEERQREMQRLQQQKREQERQRQEAERRRQEAQRQREEAERQRQNAATRRLFCPHCNSPTPHVTLSGGNLTISGDVTMESMTSFRCSVHGCYLVQR